MTISTTEPSALAIASALADERRLRILWALGDGRALPATRLAMEAGVSAPTASHHLARLVEAGLLETVPPPPHHGRNRFYRLAGPEVAALYEQLGAMAPRDPVRSLQPGTKAATIRAARTCYDHLAGRAGVAIMDALLERQALSLHDAGYALTDTGEALVGRLDIDVNELRSRRRPLIRTCVDWTEQRPHLAGALGNAVREQFVARAWIQPSPVDRAMIVTDAGRDGLRTWLGIKLDTN